MSEEREWEKVRYVAFTNYNSAVGFGGGPPFKDIKRPKDLFTLDCDKVRAKAVKIDKERAAKHVNIFKERLKKQSDENNIQSRQE